MTNDPIDDLIRSADPIDADWQPPAGAKEAARAALMAEMHGDELSARRLRSSKRSTPTRLLMAACLVLVLAVSVTVVATTMVPRSEAPATAGQLLEDAAEQSADHSIWYDIPAFSAQGQQRTRAVGTVRDVDGIRYRPVRVTESTVDGTELRTVVHGGEPEFVTRADRAKWLSDDRPALPGQPSTTTAKSVPLTFTVGPKTLTLDELTELAGDRDAVARLLTSGSDDATFRAAIVLLTAPGVPRAAVGQAYRVISDLPDLDASTEGNLATVRTRDKKLSLTFDVSTGNSLRASGISDDADDLEIQAAGIVSACIGSDSGAGPAFISLTCADNGYYLDRLRWTNWGADKATARGVAVINMCEPNCAEGKNQVRRVTVTASRRVATGFNLAQYTRLDIYYEEPVDWLLNGTDGTHDWVDWPVPK